MQQCYMWKSPIQIWNLPTVDLIHMWNTDIYSNFKGHNDGLKIMYKK